MNKFSKYFAAFASLAVLASCSNDEPTAPVNPTPEGETTAYLAINIKDANSMSRAFGENDPEEGDYVYGDKNDENTVKKANFFFFNAAGVYVTQAQVWAGGKPGTEDNVEYIGSNVLVLKGLTENNPPKYLVTVLNADDNLASEMIQGVTTINDLQKRTYNYTVSKTTTGTGDAAKTVNLMLMSTSTYEDTETTGFIPGATMLQDNCMSTEPIDETTWKDANGNAVTPLDVYVERVAAKYSFTGDPNFEFDLTLAGEENDQIGQRPVGATKVKVKITGLGVTTTADKSYLVKQLVKPNFGAGKSYQWNDKTNFRSYWGKSLYYDNTDATGLSNVKFALVAGNAYSNPVYSNENTKPFAYLKGTGDRVNGNLNTSVVFSALITDGADNPLDLVNYQGLFYLEDHFKKVVLKTLSETGKLNFWKQVKATTEVTPSVNGNIIANGYEYCQVEPNDFGVVRASTEKNDKMTLRYRTNTQLYSYDPNAEEGKKFTLLSGNNGAPALNQNIDGLISVNGYPSRYKGGNTWYSIPVEHLLGEDNNYVVTGDMEFGVVRNHWYNFTINSIMSIGHGVFDPSTGEDGDIITPDPDPKSDKFALAARVNILSWKIVRQEIDL